MSSEEKMTDIKKVAVDTVLSWTSDKHVSIIPHNNIHRKDQKILVELIEQALTTHGNKIAEDASKIAGGMRMVFIASHKLTPEQSQHNITCSQIEKAIRERLKVER